MPRSSFEACALDHGQVFTGFQQAASPPAIGSKTGVSVRQRSSDRGQRPTNVQPTGSARSTGG
jgi:hypothetical protein